MHTFNRLNEQNKKLDLSISSSGLTEMNRCTEERKYSEIQQFSLIWI